MKIFCIVFRWHVWRINLNVNDRERIHFDEKCLRCGKHRELKK